MGSPARAFGKRAVVRSAVLVIAAAAVLTGCKTTALMAPGGDYIYWGDGRSPSVAHKLRATDLVEVGSLTLPSPEATTGAVSPDGSIGYAVNSYNASGTITKIRLSDMTTLAQAPLGVADVNAMVIAPDGSYLYVAANDGTIREVRSSDLVVTRTLTAGGIAFALHSATIAPDGRYAYFGGTAGAPAAVKVHLADMTVVGTVNLPGSSMWTAMISPDGQLGYYTVGTSPTSIVAVRLADMAIVATAPLSIAASAAPASTAISPDGQYAYVMDNSNPAVLLTIRLADLVETRSETAALDGISGWSAIAPDGEVVYLGNETGAAVKVRVATATTLVVTRTGTGTGTVSSTSPGIDCGSVCTRSYLDYQSVTLTATAAAGSTFGGWSGACSGTGSACTIAMSEARSVTATFTAPKAATAPSNRMRRLHTTTRIGAGAITLTTMLDVPGPGRVAQSAAAAPSGRRLAAGQILCRAATRATAAGTVRLVCSIGGRARASLIRAPLRLLVTTSFRPDGGTARVTRRTVVLPRTPLPLPPPVAG